MKKLIKSLIFILCFILLLTCFDSIFRFKYKDGIEPLDEFYKIERNTLDVMFFGSSHMFIGVNPAILWKEQGIPSYCLGGSVQPLWNTYYYINESLKYQSPKTIVVDVYLATFVDEYSDYSRIIKNNSGLRLSFDKIESIKVSAPKKDWVNMFLEIPTYHSRYKEITKRDFQFITGRDSVYPNGYYQTTDIMPLDTPNVLNVSEETEIAPKTLEYLLKIIELAKERDIELLLTVIPYDISEDNQKIYNTVNRIAQENNIELINYNLIYDEISLDFKTDFADTSHLNNSGSQKVTSHLGNYLKNNYNLEDKRNDADYNYWNLWEAVVSSAN